MWFLKLFELLPFANKIVDTIGSYYNKKQDVDLEKYKVKGQIDIEALKADVAIIQARAELAAQMKDDPASKWGRRLLIYPTGVWFALIIWDSIARNNSILESYRWEILAIPENLQYIPYAVVAYLLVTAWKGR